MPTIVDIPPELWDQIITAACIDGGFTGTSLALTNRFFHSQSLSNRFHSLVFTSLARVEAFLASLDLQPDKCRPRIKHLYLSLAEETLRGGFQVDSQVLLNWSPERHHQACEERDSMQARLVDRFVAALTRLFALAGPHLCTLCILEPADLVLPPLPFGVLPNLRELTMQGYFLATSTNPSPEAEDTRGLTLSARFPVLERLHCIGRKSSNPAMMLATGFEGHLPLSLTHLRFSHIATAGGMFPHDFAMQLGVQLERAETTYIYSPTPGGETRLPHLRHLLVHGMKPEPPGVDGYLSRCRTVMNRRIKVISEAIWTMRELRTLVLNRPWRRDPRWAKRLFADWTDRLEGGCGCWVSSEEEEVQREVHVYYENEDVENEEDVGILLDDESVEATDGPLG